METYTNKYFKLILLVIIAMVILVFVFTLTFVKQKPKNTVEKGTKQKITKQDKIEEPKLLSSGGGLSEEELKVLEKYLIPLEQAQKRLPVKIALPTYLPEGAVLKGVMIRPIPPPEVQPNVPEKYEINLFYNNGIQIMEFTSHEDWDMEERLRKQRENVSSQLPDTTGQKRLLQKIMIKSKVGLAREKQEVVLPSGGTLTERAGVSFTMDGTGDFEYLWIGIVSDNHSLPEIVKIAESMEYPK